MKKMLLASVAALFLTTGPAHADNEKWEASFRQCHIRKWFSKDELAAIDGLARQRASRRDTRHPEGHSRNQEMQSVLPVPGRSRPRKSKALL
jgi:hypothetical protein